MNKRMLAAHSIFVAAILMFAAGAIQAQDITTPGTKATGGGRPTGGRPTGGRPTGGRPTGGRPTGGRPTGGRPTGGRPAGPVASGVNVPGNNNFRNAQLISGSAGSVAGRNTNANREPGEPGHVVANNGGAASVWYRWTAPSSGSVNFNTTGSDYDTLLAIYAGSSVNALSVVGNNDDAGGVLQSSVTFNVIAGTTYHIAVDGYQGGEGNIRLNWRMGVPVTTTTAPNNNSGNNVDSGTDASDAGGGRGTGSRGGAPANDNVINALILNGRSGRVLGTTIGATRERGEPNHGEREGNASVHYRWVAPASGRVTFTTAGSPFDTLLAVYVVSNNNVNVVAQNDDSNGTLQSTVTFNAVAGTVYIIAIDGYNNATGQFQLSWNQ